MLESCLVYWLGVHWLFFVFMFGSFWFSLVALMLPEDTKGRWE